MVGLYRAVALSGLAALILEMTWSRQLALVLGGSSYAYSATLFVVLVGIATGSLLFHLRLRRVALNPWLPVVVIGVLAADCLIGKLLLPWLSQVVGGYRDARQTLLGNAVVCVAASSVLELLPAVAMGILFPLFVDLTRQQASRVGRTVGDVYAWNTFGSIVGDLAYGRAAVSPHRNGRLGGVGGGHVRRGLAVGAAAAESCAICCGPRACLAVGAGIVAGIALPQDPRLTNLGRVSVRQPDDRWAKARKLDLYFAEGAVSNVLVTGGEGTAACASTARPMPATPGYGDANRPGVLTADFRPRGAGKY